MATFNVNSPIDFSALQNEINKPKAPGAVIPGVQIPTSQSIYGGAVTTPMFASRPQVVNNQVTPQSQYTGTLPFTGTKAQVSTTTIKTPVDTFDYNADANGVVPTSIAGITKATTPTGTPIYDGVSSTPVGYRDAYGNMTTTATPGSVAALPQGTGSNYQAELDKYYAEQKAIANTPVDENALYTQELANRQAQIDAINAMYADRVNQARIKGQGRIESRQFAQGRAGQIGSGVGEAGINAQQDANTEEQNAIRNEQAVAINAIYEKVKSEAKDRAKEKTLAKSKSADEYVSFLKSSREEQKKAGAKAIASLLSSGVDIKDMTDEQKKTYKEQLGMNDAEFESEFATQRSSIAKAEKESAKEAAEVEKIKAQTSEILANTANWGKLTEYQKGQLTQQGIKNKQDYELAKEKVTSDRAKTKSEIDVLVNTSVAGAQADGQWDNWSKDERNRFIRALGGLPSEYEI